MRGAIALRIGISVLGLYLLVAVSGAAFALDECVGDCDGDGMVRINELITGVDIALGGTQVSACPAFNCPQPFAGIFINCAVEAVDNALLGCRSATPTPTNTCTPGFNPPPGCGFEGVITPTPTPNVPRLALAVEASAFPDEHRSVTGIAWEQHETYPGECDGCTQTELAPGHYAIVARFVYRIGRNWADPTTRELTQTAEFDWPPPAGS